QVLYIIPVGHDINRLEVDQGIGKEHGEKKRLDRALQREIAFQ
ncbi:hypothetical protein OOU_Y34scaffold00967g2, partial [Pyricularia oryzae Y34]